MLSPDKAIFIITNDFPFYRWLLDVSATETAIIYGLEPVWGAAFAWAMLGERWA